MAKSDAPAFRMTVERGPRLVPATPFDAERLDTWPIGSKVKVTFVRDGGRRDERRWWAVLGRALKDTKTPWQTKEQASEAIKLALGIVNLSKTVGGAWMQYPRSLTELDDRELAEAVRDMMALLNKITGVDPADWTRETADVGEDDEEQPNAAPLTASGSEGVGDRPPAPSGTLEQSAAVDLKEAGETQEEREQPASEHIMTEDGRARLRKYAARVVNVIGGDAKFLMEEAARCKSEEGVPDGLATEKARAIRKYAARACTDFTGADPLKKDAAIKMIAGLVGCEPEDLKI